MCLLSQCYNMKVPFGFTETPWLQCPWLEVKGDLFIEYQSLWLNSSGWSGYTKPNLHLCSCLHTLSVNCPLSLELDLWVLWGPVKAELLHRGFVCPCLLPGWSAATLSQMISGVSWPTEVFLTLKRPSWAWCISWGHLLWPELAHVYLLSYWLWAKASTSVR